MQEPRIRHSPKVDSTASADDAIKLAAAYGLHLIPWQQNALRVLLGETRDGKWAARRGGVSVPRQNGKGALIEALELAGLFMFGERTIIHSAHEHRTAQDGFKRLLGYFENYDDLRKKVKKVGTAIAREYIELTTGQSVRFFTRTKSAGRGFPVDRMILDEAQDLTDDEWQAMLPTISNRPNPQITLLGTPPPLGQGDVFRRMRENGLKKAERLVWLEWSAEDGLDLDDPRGWCQANPSMGLLWLTGETVAGEREDLSELGFACERLGQWAAAQTISVVDTQTWKSLADPQAVTTGQVAYAIDVSPDRSRASISMAGWTPTGKRLLEFVEGRNSADWVVHVAKLITAKQRPKCFVVDGGSPAGAYVQALQEARVPLEIVGAREYAAACGKFYDEAYGGLLTHLDQPTLNSALSVARKRPIGSEGAWGWHRLNTEADITPIVSATLALHGVGVDMKIKRPSQLYAF